MDAQAPELKQLKAKKKKLKLTKVVPSKTSILINFPQTSSNNCASAPSFVAATTALVLLKKKLLNNRKKATRPYKHFFPLHEHETNLNKKKEVFFLHPKKKLKQRIKSQGTR